MTIFAWLRIIYAVCLLITATIGWRRGGRTERWGVAIIVTASLLTVLIMSAPLFNWKTRVGPLVAVDVATFFALLALALRTTRFWPIWATSFHLIALCTHGAIPILPSGLRQAYALLQGFWAYPIMACIIIGALSRRAEAQIAARINTDM